MLLHLLSLTLNSAMGVAVGHQMTVLTTVERESILFPRRVNMFDLTIVILNNVSVLGFISSAATGYILFSTAPLPKLEDFRC